MRLYATSPVRRTRQLTGDLLVLGWVVIWVLVGRWVFALVQTLAAPADPLRRAGTAWSDRMTDVADQVTRIPMVGEELTAPFDGAAEAGTDLVTAGDRLEASVTTVAWVVSLLSAGTPILLVVLFWVLLRARWIRRAAALGDQLEDPASVELLALRALVTQSPRRLQRAHADPVAAFRSQDPASLRALADLELADLGLRLPRRR